MTTGRKGQQKSRSLIKHLCSRSVPRKSVKKLTHLKFDESASEIAFWPVVRDFLLEGTNFICIPKCLQGGLSLVTGGSVLLRFACTIIELVRMTGLPYETDEARRI
jgi:hypothetical protein